MSETDLATRFDAHRPRLHAVAYRVLGSFADADDAVQEAWLRLGRTGGDAVDNLGGWLTTVVGRVALDMLRARAARREDPLDGGLPDPVVAWPTGAATPAPEEAALRTDAVGLALMVVLETLSPPERLVFVLHDLFAVPFAEIGAVVGRSPAAAKQLASRARRRVRERVPPSAAVDVPRHREVVAAFLAATRDGDLQGLLSVLDAEVVLRVDRGPAPGRPDVVEFSGAAAVAGQALRLLPSRPLRAPGPGRRGTGADHRRGRGGALPAGLHPAPRADRRDRPLRRPRAAAAPVAGSGCGPRRRPRSGGAVAERHVRQPLGDLPDALGVLGAAQRA